MDGSAMLRKERCEGRRRLTTVNRAKSVRSSHGTAIPRTAVEEEKEKASGAIDDASSVHLGQHPNNEEKPHRRKHGKD